ncbi:PGG domain containing protein [Trema orientale]|uniref:PGG domain containing protein n=1 Tax=Trema orientale TaxID=63057 RepID=A0A2P5AAC8_TREOI|nr:PGG domain containing protein [Trema orientale]
MERLNIVSGAALQMQLELLWFKEIEKIMPPSIKEKENNEHETARAIFSKTHKDLLKEGESWMKKTAESCTIVATLIATVVFATAFSVPGGNDSDTGIPIHLKYNLYSVFSLSNGVAMFSSSTSILMFLSILTSRYAEHDFLRSLPLRLIVGLTALFISMATMTVAFCMAFFIAYRRGSMWIPVLIATLQLVPVTLFLYLFYPLLIDIFFSTFYSHSLFNPSKRMLQWAGDT